MSSCNCIRGMICDSVASTLACRVYQAAQDDRRQEQIAHRLQHKLQRKLQQ